MASNPVWEICERMAEMQALLHDHAECGKYTAADVVAKAQEVLSESALFRAIVRCRLFLAEYAPGWTYRLNDDGPSERFRSVRAVPGEHRPFTAENGPQPFSLTDGNKKTIPRFFTTAS
jgi:hypothetical protein